MNERILELARQVWPDPSISHVNHEKFAELIVRKCVDIIDPKTGTKWIKDQTQEEFWKNQSVHLIKQHFGVEE
jgi:hypothetical protein